MTLPPHALEAQRRAEKLRGQGDQPIPLFPAPARDSDCPDPLHDHPLPGGYAAAANEADRRLDASWDNRQCTRCGLYGWEPPEAAS